MPSDSKPTVAAPFGEPPADLVVDDLEAGAGDEAQAGAQVEVHYVGVAWSSGDQFDASWDRGQPFSFRSRRRPGHRRLGPGGAGHACRRPAPAHHPAAPRLRSRGAGGVIKPNETLVFVVDLLAVR